MISKCGRPGGNVRLRAFGALALAVAVAELTLCFAGPMALIRKPSLMLFPPFSSSLGDEQTRAATAKIERHLALTRSYSITSHSFIEEYYIRTDPEWDRSRLKPVDYMEARKIAQELELQRYAVAWIHCSGSGCELSVSIRDAGDGSVLRSGRFVSDSLEKLLEGVGTDGRPLDFSESLAVESRGITFTGSLILAVFTLQLAVGLLAVCGREPGLLIELTWASALILFLFAYIYALSANMDYVQRYIASHGRLRLAANTTLEQLHACLRFLPLLIVDGAGYIRRNLRWGRADRPGGQEAWLHGVVARWALPWVVLSAGLFGLSFPSVVRLEGMGWLAWFSLVPVFLVLLTVKPARAVFYGVAFGTLQALIINYWQGIYDYVTLHLIAIAFVVEYLLFMAALVALIRLSGKWGFLSAPCAWVLFDYLRSVGVLGYPWGLSGATQYRLLPLIQIASLTGVWGIDFIVLLGNAALAWSLAAPAFGWTWIGAPRPLRRPELNRERQGRRRLAERIAAGIRSAVGGPPTLFPFGLFAGVLLICLIAGAVILQTVDARLYGNPQVPKATVLLLQQNTDPRKHEYRENLHTLMTLTDQALAGLEGKPDLIAWPEGGFKLDIRYWGSAERKETYWGGVVQEFIAYQSGLGTWLATGTQDHEMVSVDDGEPERVNFNSSVLLDPEGRISAFYHKIHLVPFSEYFPLDKQRFAGLYALFQKYDISDWGVGENLVVFQHDRMRFATPICFEDVFPDQVRRFVLRDVDLILNMSNDYWSLSPVEGRQHGLLSLFRAVENRRPLLRATSSGYTVYIDAAGRIQPGSPEPYTAGYTVARVPLPEKRLTPYTRWGDWFPLACGLGILPILALNVVKRLRRRQTDRSAA